MNKRVIIVLVLFAVAGHLAFAGDAGETPVGTLPSGGRQAYSGEAITLSGTLDLQPGNAFAVLQTGSEAWGLMLPRMYGYDIPVKSGDDLTVTGFEVPGPRWSAGGRGRYLMVESAVISGREYVLPGEYERYDMMGWGGDRWGHGRRGGYAYQRGCW